MKEITAGVFVAFEFEQATFLRLEEQIAKSAKTIGALIKTGMLTFDRLLHPRAVHSVFFAPLRPQGVERVAQKIECFIDGRSLVFCPNDFRLGCRGRTADVSGPLRSAPGRRSK